jgi:hypothetical protein
MQYKNLLKISLFTIFLGTVASVEAATTDKLWETIERQQQQIEELNEKIEATSVMIEDNAGSTATSWLEKSKFGGYGELHYNNLDNSKVGGSDKKEIDFHRFVLFFGHDFTDKIRFFSELEVEHALSGDGKPGEVELEQAYIDLDINSQLTARAGLFLLPIGILNETHEPPTFYGTERNPVEKYIIPSTWWEAGVNMIGKPLPGLQYDLAVHSGLSANAYDIRKGRKKVAKAPADNLAMTGRLKYTAIKGLELATSLQYQDDITQGKDPSAASAILWETHAIYSIQRFMIRALYAQWSIDGDGPKSTGQDEQFGYYIEPSYKFNEKFGVFARYNIWDNSAGNNQDTEYQQIDFGVNYWLHPDVVVKLDYQIQNTPDGKNEFDGFNIGIGYQFY